MEEFVLYEPMWFNTNGCLCGTKSETGIKIKRKTPFEQRVLTFNNEIWDYCIQDGKVIYSYYCSLFETQQNCKFPQEVETVELLQVVEILDVTEKAQKSIKTVGVWKM